MEETPQDYVDFVTTTGFAALIETIDDYDKLSLLEAAVKLTSDDLE